MKSRRQRMKQVRFLTFKQLSNCVVLFYFVHSSTVKNPLVFGSTVAGASQKK